MRRGAERAAAMALMAFCAMLLWAAGAGAGNPLEQLLMPGPVAAPHAKIEQDCRACHKPFEKAAQDHLCLACHKPVAADIAGHRGFHGMSPLMKGAACSLCHDDHKGRSFDMLGLDRAAFPHHDTDFALTGVHRLAGCNECHAPGKRFAEAPSACFSCHGKDDRHRGNLGRECQTCHNTADWRRTAAFDHAKTRFPLTGKHAGPTCAACHVDETYKGLGTECATCHVIDDVHQNRFGARCETCHADTGWKPARFDHKAHTSFPLKGAHAAAACSACHGADLLRPLATACADCHTAQDVHKGVLGARCETCHGEASWRQSVRFDHDLTRFPLSGLHAAVACEACHASQTFKAAPAACASCHAADDVHEGRLTAACESCHSASGWTRVHFDHGRDTRFSLTGKHAAAACYSCHAKKHVRSAALPRDCFSCHAREDVHRGAFGTGCGRCHGTTTFRSAVIRP